MPDSEEVVVNKNKAHRKDKRVFINNFSFLRLSTSYFNLPAWDTDDIDQ